jgi:hypothetical protein
MHGAVDGAGFAGAAIVFDFSGQRRFIHETCRLDRESAKSSLLSSGATAGPAQQCFLHGLLKS